MSINEKVLRHLLMNERLTHGNAAKKLGVSTRTITRAVAKFGLQGGRGITHRWEFITYNSSLAYLVGLYLTDGYNIRGGVGFGSTEPVLIEQFAEALHNLHLPIVKTTITPDANHKGTKPISEIRSYSTLFSKWLIDEFQSKTLIPAQLINDSSLRIQLMFVAGIIDGDGHVAKDGSILIRTTNQWLNGLGDLLQKMNIRHTFRIERILPSGKPYGAVTIRRSDYRSLGGTCFHPIRAWRIEHAKDLRKR